MISIIAVIGKNRELGKNNKLLWHIPGDLPRFRQITSGHPVIMGRKTYESIGKPLPKRSNIVISKDLSETTEGIFVVRSLEEGINIAKKQTGNEEIFVIGGGKTYQEAMKYVDRLYLTVVDSQAEADTFFPDYSMFVHELSSEPHSEGGYNFTYLTLER